MTGSLQEYAYDLVESGAMEGAYDNYFDFEKFGRDVRYSGEFADLIYENEGEEAGEKLGLEHSNICLTTN